MTKRRNRKKQELPLEQRLIEFSAKWKREAERATGPEAFDNWQQRARSTEAALGIIEWLAAGREQRR